MCRCGKSAPSSVYAASLNDFIRLFFSVFISVIIEIGNGLEFSTLQEAIPGLGSARLLNFQYTPSSFLTYENQLNFRPVDLNQDN